MEGYRIRSGVTFSLPNNVGNGHIGVVWVDPKKVNDTEFLLEIVESDVLAKPPLPVSYDIYFTDAREVMERALRGQNVFPLKVVHRLHYDEHLAERYPKGYFDFPTDV